jgi:hypothetical protein
MLEQIFHALQALGQLYGYVALMVVSYFTAYKTTSWVRSWEHFPKARRTKVSGYVSCIGGISLICFTPLIRLGLTRFSESCFLCGVLLFPALAGMYRANVKDGRRNGNKSIPG